jgi:hypothetical protein
MTELDTTKEARIDFQKANLPEAETGVAKEQL